MINAVFIKLMSIIVVVAVALPAKADVSSPNKIDPNSTAFILGFLRYSQGPYYPGRYYSEDLKDYLEGFSEGAKEESSRNIIIDLLNVLNKRFSLGDTIEVMSFGAIKAPIITAEVYKRLTWTEAGRDDNWQPVLEGHLTLESLRQFTKEEELSFLAGALLRDGEQVDAETYRITTEEYTVYTVEAKDKADIIALLLRLNGVYDVVLERRYGLSNISRLTFKPTAEVTEWLTQYRQKLNF